MALSSPLWVRTPKAGAQNRWDEKVDPRSTDRVKLPVINAICGAIPMDKEIDPWRRIPILHEEGTESEAGESPAPPVQRLSRPAEFHHHAESARGLAPRAAAG